MHVVNIGLHDATAIFPIACSAEQYLVYHLSSILEY